VPRRRVVDSITAVVPCALKLPSFRKTNFIVRHILVPLALPRQMMMIWTGCSVRPLEVQYCYTCEIYLHFCISQLKYFIADKYEMCSYRHNVRQYCISIVMKFMLNSNNNNNNGFL